MSPKPTHESNLAEMAKYLTARRMTEVLYVHGTRNALKVDASMRLYASVAKLLLFCLTLILIAGCAHKTGATAFNDAQKAFWTGRIGLQIESEPPQSFFASFELKGQAEQGELMLTSPIGSTLAVMRWGPGEAVLESGGQLKRFDSVDTLLERSTGAAIPVSALFDWLNGKSTSLNGWTADLSQQATGRVEAVRAAPLPATKLRIVFEN